MSIRIDDTWYERPPEMTEERVSAGGVVVRIEQGALLVALVREIDTRGWTYEGYVLPKGGVSPGEDLEAAAAREIEEEIGLTEITRIGALDILERQGANHEWWAYNHYGLYVTEQISGEIIDKEHHFDPGWFPLEALPEMFWPDEKNMIESRRMEIYDRVIAHQNPKGRKKGFM